MSQPEQFPSLYIPHGGGPCFFMDWTLGSANTWDKMAAWLGQLFKSVGHKPKAIVVFSAHWESPQVTINASSTPSLIYDYYGFPAHTYSIQYPAPGSPEIASRIIELLNNSNIDATLDPVHGLDHGVFIPFKLIYPPADIPIVQVSLLANLSPEEHFAIGQALQPLRSEQVLIVGSGLSYHNMGVLMNSQTRNDDADHFDNWLTETCTSDPEIRKKRLFNWQTAPSARNAHPREEHLIPLMVAAGAASNEEGHCLFTDRVMGATVSGYQFGKSLLR